MPEGFDSISSPQETSGLLGKGQGRCGELYGHEVHTECTKQIREQGWVINEQGWFLNGITAPGSLILMGRKRGPRLLLLLGKLVSAQGSVAKLHRFCVHEYVLGFIGMTLTA